MTNINMTRVLIFSFSLLVVSVMADNGETDTIINLSMEYVEKVSEFLPAGDTVDVQKKLADTLRSCVPKIQKPEVEHVINYLKKGIAIADKCADSTRHAIDVEDKKIMYWDCMRKDVDSLNAQLNEAEKESLAKFKNCGIVP